MSFARTRFAARLLAVAALAALTAGCFQPMYAEHTDGTPGLREKLTGGTSTPISFSRSPGVPSVCSAYIGWKQPAVSAAKAATTRSRAAIRMLANDIHDPHGNNNDLADGLAAQG